MSSQDLPDDFMLSDSQLREVVERASRADQKPAGISIAMLRQIAAELEIDPVALERALDDVVGLPVHGRPLRNWFTRRTTSICRFLSQLLPREGRFATSVVIGASLGWLSAAVAKSLLISVGGMTVAKGGAAFVDVPIAIAMILLTLVNSLARRHEGRLGKYLAETAAIWGASATAWGVTYGKLSSDLTLWTLGCLASATIWGIMIIRRSSPPGLGSSALPVDLGRLPVVKSKPDNELRRVRIGPAGLIAGVWVGFR